MFSTILGAILPVLAVALIGFGWTRLGRSFDGPTLTPLVTEIGTPCLVFSTYAHSSVAPASFVASSAASIAIIVAVLAIGAVVLKAAGLRLRTYLPAMAFPNSGNLGLPLALYAFGPEGLTYAILFLTFNSLLNFTIGQAIAAGAMDWRAVLRMPIVYAAVLGLAVSGFGIALPKFLADTVALLGSLTVPLMLLLLGASLGRLRVAAFPRAFCLSLLRIGMGFLVGWAVTAAFGLEGVARDALIQQSAMPAAVFNYLFALRWNNQPEEIAGIVVVSTLLAILTAPAVLYFLLG